jgi:precorrin-8X/cobalt-precorrin-8 methylmutase
VPFDRIVIVDWSANSRPKLGADSIWIADDDGSSTTVENLATRTQAFDRLCHIVDGAAGRTLIGVDFSLGYPAGTAAALGLVGTPWRAMWDLLQSEIVDDGLNRNNRFEVAAELNRRMSDGGASPFWGCPPGHATSSLRATKPTRTDAHEPAEWRRVERELRASGRRPFSSWQLLGAGAVGSQSLVGIPMVERLRVRSPDRVDVWPFTTGLRAPEPRLGGVVIAEVWPSLIAVDDDVHDVRDACQVRAVARWLRTAQDTGQLGELWCGGVVDDERVAVVAEEGWVLGMCSARDDDAHRG